LKIKRIAEISQLPPGASPLLEIAYNGMKSLIENAVEGTVTDMVNIIEWYLESYTAFPQVGSGKKAGVGEPIMDLQFRRPGRPRNTAYDEAFAFIVSKKMDFKEAFEWYCEQEGITKPTKDDRNAFKAAMKRRQKDT
jgi:hypothetical protein